MLLHGYYPATILSYNAEERTAQISIPGMTDGAEDGLTAEFAYPVGEDDRDTERLVKVGAEVWIFFEMGQANAPIIAFYRGHQVGAVVDVRRIRQKNIEILATTKITMKAPDVKIECDAYVVECKTAVINATDKIELRAPMISENGL